jgi:hypothetical protein
MTPSPTITVSQAEHQAERMTCDEPSHDRTAGHRPSKRLPQERHRPPSGIPDAQACRQSHNNTSRKEHRNHSLLHGGMALN